MCKDTAIQPAKLSRGRAPKPLLQLGRKRGKKPPTSPAKTKDAASDNGEKSVNDGATEEQVHFHAILNVTKLSTHCCIALHDHCVVLIDK